MLMIDMICIWHPFECDMGLDGILTSHIERVADEFGMENGCHMHFLARNTLKFKLKTNFKYHKPPLQTIECDMASDQNCT